MPKPNAPKELSPLEIEMELQSLPRKLWTLNSKVVKCHQSFLEAEKEYEDAADRAYLSVKAANPDATVKEIEAAAGAAVSDKRLAMIVAQAKYEAAKNDAEACDKMLGAVQSIVKLRSSEMRSGM